MERLEDAQRDVTRLHGERAGIEGERRSRPRPGTSRRPDRGAASTVSAERAEVAGGIAADLLALYERLRAQLGGVGAAPSSTAAAAAAGWTSGPPTWPDAGRRAGRGPSLRGVQPDPGTHERVWDLSARAHAGPGRGRRRLARQPGPAGYGAVLKDASTGAVIAEAYESLGIATNNVAEYRGLIAALEPYREHTPDAELEVRMDSKLVIEQMSGRWKVKHPDMRPLAIRARAWLPRTPSGPGFRGPGTSTPTGSPTGQWTRLLAARSLAALTRPDPVGRRPPTGAVRPRCSATSARGASRRARSRTHRRTTSTRPSSARRLARARSSGGPG